MYFVACMHALMSAGIPTDCYCPAVYCPFSAIMTTELELVAQEQLSCYCPKCKLRI